MSRRSLLLLLCVSMSSLMFSALAAQAQGHGQGKGKNKQVEREDARDHVGFIFSDRDREIIQDYFRGGHSNLPPGLAKRGGKLPPGLEKHLQKNGTLPPGLQKRLTPFPADLDRRLPRLPDIYRRGTIGGAVVIIDRRTQRIMDVINDIIRP